MDRDFINAQKVVHRAKFAIELNYLYDCIIHEAKHGEECLVYKIPTFFTDGDKKHLKELLSNSGFYVEEASNKRNLITVWWSMY